jgi:hypothetical protein
MQIGPDAAVQSNLSANFENIQSDSSIIEEKKSKIPADLQAGNLGEPLPEVDLAGSNLGGLRVLRCIDWLHDRISDGNLGSEDAEMVHKSSFSVWAYLTFAALEG